MNASPLDTLRDLFGEQFEALAGGTVAGELPIPSDVINRLVARKLATSKGPIAGADVVAAGNDTFTVRVRPRAALPPLTVDVRIERQPQLPDDPMLGLRWAVRGIGRLALLASPVISYFATMPPGMRLDGDRLSVDIHEMLRRQRLDALVPFLTALRVGTRVGAFVVQFEIRR